MSATITSKMKIPKTETEYNLKSIKFLLLTITTMFIVIAGLMIVLGLSVYSKYHNLTFLYESAKSGNLFTPSILVVLLGLTMFIVTMFGFFGSIKESTCMVNSYAVVLFMVLVVELAVVGVAFTTDGAKLMDHINVPVEYYTTDPEIQAEFDIMQINLNCCGSDSFLDYVGQEFSANHTTVVTTTTVSGDHISLVLPQSCCALYEQSICNRIRQPGCKEALVNVVLQNASVLGVLGVSVMFIQVLGITFALLLARCMRKMKSERALLKWKVCEQMINARKAEDEPAEQTLQTVYIQRSRSSCA